jgi:hypothetical protein
VEVEIMKKRNQINITIEDEDVELINEYCRVNDRTPQWLFKTGAQRLIDEDMQERKADLMTIQSWREINNGLSQPIDDLLEMIAEDKKIGDKMISKQLHEAKKSA